MKPGVTVYMKVIKAVWNWKQLKRSREQESKRELSLGVPIITYRVKGRMEKQPSGVTIIIIIGGAGIVILDQDFCSCVLVFCRNCSSGIRNYVIRNCVRERRLRRRIRENG